MSFDADELIPFKGNMVAKGVIFHKVKSLGWSGRLFATLTDEEIAHVMEHRKSPQQMGKNAAATFDPKGIIDVNSEEGSIPEIMGAKPGVPGTPGRDETGPIPVGTPAGESGVVATAIAPSTLAAGKHLRPVDPTRPQRPETQAAPAPLPSSVPQRAVTITVKPPRTDHQKLHSMLEAAFALAQNEATYSTAKTLITTNGLERPFQSLHTDLYKKIFGKLDLTPDSKCRGGIVLDIEMEVENGYIHIITNAGTITITGQQLALHGAQA